jgi:hypothetical protein
MDVTQNKGTLFYLGHHKHVFIFFQSHENGCNTE